MKFHTACGSRKCTAHVTATKSEKLSWAMTFAQTSIVNLKTKIPHSSQRMRFASYVTKNPQQRDGLRAQSARDAMRLFGSVKKALSHTESPFSVVFLTKCGRFNMPPEHQVNYYSTFQSYATKVNKRFIAFNEVFSGKQTRQCSDVSETNSAREDFTEFCRHERLKTFYRIFNSLHVSAQFCTLHLNICRALYKLLQVKCVHVLIV